MVAISIQHWDFRCQLLYLFVQASYLSAKLVHVTPEHIHSIRTIQKHAHSVAREVRYASRTGD
jgi:hypothetical protein